MLQLLLLAAQHNRQLPVLLTNLQWTSEWLGELQCVGVYRGVPDAEQRALAHSHGAHGGLPGRDDKLLACREHQRMDRENGVIFFD